MVRKSGAHLWFLAAVVGMWVSEYAGATIAARNPGSEKLPVIEDAPALTCGFGWLEPQVLERTRAKSSRRCLASSCTLAVGPKSAQAIPPYSRHCALTFRGRLERPLSDPD